MLLNSCFLIDCEEDTDAASGRNVWGLAYLTEPELIPRVAHLLYDVRW